MHQHHSADESIKATCGLCCTKVENFGVAYGKSVILDNVNLHIHCGELTALVGPNGAGKSTLLRAMLGEIPHTGELRFLDNSDARIRKPVIGYIPQRIEFDTGAPISVMDLFSASQTGIPVWFKHLRKLRERILYSLSRVQAEHLIDRRLGDLSGGELQRFLLALALEPIPDLLLLDEPIWGVDRPGKTNFYRIVSDLRHQFDLSIILVSHDLDMVLKHADRVVLLNKTVQCSGTPEEVFSNQKAVQAFGTVWLGK